MTRAGDVFVRFCASLQDWPAAVLCVFISVLQMIVMDFYLVDHLGTLHLAWMGLDAVNVTLLGICIFQARRAIHSQVVSSHDDGGGLPVPIASGSMGWIVWLCLSISVAAKTVFIFDRFASSLDEEDPGFWGPNTLKTTIALGSCTFILLLITQHDAPPGSDGRQYIEELTGSVAFDILDTVDILEVLFDADMRPKLWAGMVEFILAVGVLNLLLPTVPLYTLAKSRFGQKKLSKRLVRGHRLLLVLAVNCPNLLVRMLLWHGLSAGVSPFTLKNIIAILLTLYEFYEHKKEVYEDHKREEKTDTHNDNGMAPKKEVEHIKMGRSNGDRHRPRSSSSSNNAYRDDDSPDSVCKPPRDSDSMDRETPSRGGRPGYRRDRPRREKYADHGRLASESDGSDYDVKLKVDRRATDTNFSSV